MRRGHQGRTDGNQQAIIDALRAEGASVQSLASVGAGVPDLLVGAKGRTYLVEVKDGEKCPSHRKLTPDQKRWILKWKGKPPVVLLDAGKALSWARRIATPYSTQDYLDAWGSGVA